MGQPTNPAPGQIKIAAALLVILSLAACHPVAHIPAGGSSPTAATPATQSSPTSTGIENLTILYTNDEHGWMEGEQKGNGAANLFALWRQNEGYNPQGNFLVLSGGDSWTGPAVSSWFQGQSMVEVMNSMGFAASAVGNHEFDFGLQNLKQRRGEAQFSYLSANIRYKNDRKIPEDLGIQPYVILTAGAMRVGVVGLTTQQTAHITNPNVTGGFEFEDYAGALRQYVPQMRNAGADVIVVIGHVCSAELQVLAAQVEDLGIAMFGGGHCHEVYQGWNGATPIVEAGSNFRDYAAVRLTVDLDSARILESKSALSQNQGGTVDATVQAIVDRWHNKAQSELNGTIGYLKEALPKGSPSQQALATETWLIAYPSAQVALTNLGGFRDRLPSGEISLADITSVFPFNDVLVDVTLTGDQLKQVINEAPYSTAIGGIHKQNGQWVFNSNGAPLDPAASYHVLVNDFMYAGGDNYRLLAKFDRHAYNTSIDWRQPIIDWIRSKNSSRDHPLDTAIAQLGH